MQFENLLFEVRDQVAHLTFNRPAAMNAMNIDTAKELMHAAIRCDEDDGIRAVIITGTGDKAFCAGGDLSGFAAAGDNATVMIKEMTAYLHAGVSRLVRMDAPVIAAVNGVAAGAGFSMACIADLAIAAAGARFTMAYTRAGLTPDGSSTFFLTRLVGVRRALELTLTNRVLSAAEALEWGLINRVVADDQLAQEAEALARNLANGPTRALGGAKQLLYAGTSESLETQMELEARRITEAVRSADGREGIAAFLAKRTPNFVGR